MAKSAQALVIPGDMARKIYTCFAIPITLCAANEYKQYGEIISFNRGDLAVALGLLTGRREAELLLTGHFGETGYPYIANFSGQLKKRGVATTFPIPLMAPVKDVQLAIEGMRRLFPLPANAIPRNVNTRYCHALSEAVKGRLNRLLGGETDQEMHFHRLREIYAIVSYDVTKPRGKSGLVIGALSLHEHIRRVLGHEMLGTSQNYACCQIDGTTGLHVDGF